MTMQSDPAQDGAKRRAGSDLGHMGWVSHSSREKVILVLKERPAFPGPSRDTGYKA